MVFMAVYCKFFPGWGVFFLEVQIYPLKNLVVGRGMLGKTHKSIFSQGTSFGRFFETPYRETPVPKIPKNRNFFELGGRIGLSRDMVSIRHLQRTYSARETGVMQELEKHNLTRITNAPAEFLIQF